MSGLEEGTAAHLEALLGAIDTPTRASADAQVETSFNTNSFQVRLRYFELVGKRCIDLISKKRGVELKLMNDGAEAVRPRGAAEPVVHDGDHLLALLRFGKGRRATAATDVNGGSSRSHAVCQVIVERIGGAPGDMDAGDGIAGGGRGLLTLVDCAGSERKEDSMYHSKCVAFRVCACRLACSTSRSACVVMSACVAVCARRERQRESTEINASLYALKECVRARALLARGKRVKIPFRSSNLTKVLMESFVREDAHLAVIATVSPIPTDTEHSVATLKTVCAIAGFGEDSMREEKDEVKRNLPAREHRVHPSKWSADQFLEWLNGVAGGRFQRIIPLIPRGTSGKQVGAL